MADLNPSTRTVTGPHGAVRLGAMPFRLAHLLATRKERLTTQAEVMSSLYGERERQPTLDVTRVHVMTVRRALRRVGSPATIETVWGDGWIWCS